MKRWGGKGYEEGLKGMLGKGFLNRDRKRWRVKGTGRELIGRDGEERDRKRLEGEEIGRKRDGNK